MANSNQHNFSKDRKPEEQKQFEAADNAGRFAGDDQDAKQAFNQFSQNADAANAQRNEGRVQEDEEPSNRDAHRDPAQAHNYDGEAQNINDESLPPMNDDEAQRAKNKATEGMRQGREGKS